MTHPASRATRLSLPALALLVIGSVAAADPLMIQGSTTFNRALMEPFQAEIEKATGHQLTIVPNKSMPGLIALLEGRAHMAMLSAPLESEIALMQKSMPGLQFESLRAHEITRTRVAIVVHKTNPVRRASLDQITQIMQGKIANWNMLDGPDLPIRVVLVGGGGGVTVLVESSLLQGQQANPPNKIYLRSPVQLAQVVEQEPAAIGFAQLAIARNRGLIELATDRSIEQTLYLITLGEPTPAMRSVINATRSIAARAM